MEYDFSKIELHPEQLKFLKTLGRRGAQAPGRLDIGDLFASGLVLPSARCRDERELKELAISAKGKLYLRWRSEDRFRHRWPVYLSIASFAVSLCSLALSIAALCA